MQYEWDPAKAHANASKHGVHSADAVAAFEDEHALTIRDSFSEDEERWITAGQDVFRRIVLVVYVWRGEKIRMISARLATPRERREYRRTYETRIRL